jgi:hypothetical protein
MYAAVGLRLPPTGFVQRFCFLENLQVLHETSGGTPSPLLCKCSKCVSYIT